MANEADATMPEDTPAAQWAATVERMNASNRMLPQGLAPFQPPPWTEVACGLDALVGMLIAQGVIDEAAFVERKTLRMVEIVNQMLDKFAEAKRHALGLVLAGPSPQI